MSNIHKPLIELIRHELGHYYVAKYLNFTPTKIKLYEYGATCHIDIYKELKSKEALKEYLENRIKILFAGVIAEVNIYNEPSENHKDKYQELLQTSANGDLGKIDELKYILLNFYEKNIKNPDDELKKLNEIIYKQWDLTFNILKQYKGEINFIAEVLSNNLNIKEISTSDISKLELDYKKEK